MSEIVRCDGCSKEDTEDNITNWRQLLPFGQMFWTYGNGERLHASYHFCSWKCIKKFVDDYIEMDGERT